MKLSREDVSHIAILSRIGVSDDEMLQFQKQLSGIMESFDTLKQVDTDGVPPTVEPNTFCNILHDDCAQPSLSSDAVLAGAPRQEGSFFRICAVMEDS